MRHIVTAIAASLFGLVLVPISPAQQTSTTAVPNLIRYGGTLKDAQGAVLSWATVGVTFAIYKEQDGGAPVWLETQNVTTDASGNYSVLLGSTTATRLPDDLFAQQEQRWLGVQVQGQPEQSRVLLVAVPYAFRALEAEKLAGHSASEFVTTDTLQSAVQQQLQQQSGAASSPATTGGGKSTQDGKQSSPADGPTNFSGSTDDQIVGVTQSGIGAGLISTATDNAIFGVARGANGTGVHGRATAQGGIGMWGSSLATAEAASACAGLCKVQPAQQECSTTRQVA